MLQDKNFEKATFKIDWDKWVDQDEADEGFDTSALVMFS
jgi:cytosolic prostaglandin-E synthase